jgi:hypothetical protein
VEICFSKSSIYLDKQFDFVQLLKLLKIYKEFLNILMGVFLGIPIKDLKLWRNEE